MYDMYTYICTCTSTNDTPAHIYICIAIKRVTCQNRMSFASKQGPK